MKESLNWREELLASQRFNKKEEKLLKYGAKSLAQSWWLGALYVRYKKLKGLHLKDPIENKGQLQSSFKEFERRI
tara:strand:- start:656 stop:880 length:225 start_codon:yes stop_codon:yes gene_type:complete